MCDHDPFSKTSFDTPAHAAGSRRRRLWELPPQAHCPVVGVCLPVERLRQLVEKVFGPLSADDYAVHVGVVSESRNRSPFTERLQKELDTRFAIALGQAARHKSAEALAQWWREGCREAEVAGVFWATLTHPRCDEALEERVLRDVHMLQHQLGASRRVDLERHEELAREHRALVQELGRAQQRTSLLIAEKSARLERQRVEMARLRAETARLRDTVDRLRAESAESAQAQAVLCQLQAAPATRPAGEPEPLSTSSPASERDPESTKLQARKPVSLPWRPVNEHDSAGIGRPASAEVPAEAVAPAAAPPLDRLRDKAVLCVGGRRASVPAYRRLVERSGGRFFHHDGGAEDKVARLEACLASADLVICQTGCVSHNAYWRVKDHCKRTGKQCLFVDNPSASSLERGLSGAATSLAQPATHACLAQQPARPGGAAPAPGQ